MGTGLHSSRDVFRKANFPRRLNLRPAPKNPFNSNRIPNLLTFLNSFKPNFKINREFIESRAPH